MKELTLLFPVLAGAIMLFRKKESKDWVWPRSFGLTSDYISFGFYQDMNFVQEDFQLEVIYKVRVIVLIVVVS